MTREQVYEQCKQQLCQSSCLLLELPTGYGKTKLSIDLANYLLSSQWYKDTKKVNILLLVAKRVHKQTWNEEIEKWGGINHPTASVNIRVECYESMHKCAGHWDIVIADETHHIGSDSRLELLKAIHYGYFLGLSATIPKKLKQFFQFRYKAQIVSCDIIEAIEDEILPEPQILLYPLMLDNRQATETWEINAKAKGAIVYGEYKDYWKLKKQKAHAYISMTQKQKLLEFDRLIAWEKSKYMQTRAEAVKQSWLFHAGKRLEFLADSKLPVIKDILRHLRNSRTITFCKSISQAEQVSEYCIHSKNTDSDQIYNDFNKKKINHISAVNILNENANLVDCKYAVFTNLSSSEISVPQRIGRSMRHKAPVIIVPYYAGTREEELAKRMVEGFNKEYIKVIRSIQEIQ